MSTSSAIELAQAIEDHMTTGLDEHQRNQLSDLLRHCVTALETPTRT